MGRRPVGLILLALTLLAVLIVPALGGRRIAGAAQRVPPPDPPKVGDCIDAGPTGRSALDLQVPVIAHTTGPCDNGSTGEIVKVSKLSFSPPTLDNGVSHVDLPDCEPAMRDYLGWPDSEWQMPASISSEILGPGLLQYIAGQRWIACVVAPKFVPFSGSLKDSVHTGTGAIAFAACQPIGRPGVVAKCTARHQIELFGSVQTSTPHTELTQSCASLIAAVTGMADVTHGGDFVVSLLVTSTTDGERAECTLSLEGSRELVGTLIGIGAGEPPWG